MEAFIQDIIQSNKDMQSFWENRFAQFMEEMVKSQTFVDTMTRSLDSSLDMRRMFDSSMGRWAEFYQIVTKKDLALLQQQIYDQGARTEKMLTVLTEIRDQLAVKPMAGNSGNAGDLRPNSKTEPVKIAKKGH